VEPLTTHPFTFLFVGTLGYYPNEDAVVFFCREVLPKLRAAADASFLLRIAGSGLPEGLRALARLPEVRLSGYAPDIARLYADADAVVVPLRAGGGTRIKVLEAFAYQRPVVSTSMGIEGIDAVAGEHYLLGDTAGELARQCLRLMRDRELGKELAGRAHKLVTRQYAPQRLVDAVSPT
jgi:glycosyltransferase involved in cell wall biosynthesis